MEILQKFSKKAGLAVLVGGVGPSGKAFGRLSLGEPESLPFGAKPVPV
jgi:hypothetical protein